MPLDRFEKILYTQKLKGAMPFVMAWTPGTSTHIFRLEKTHPMFEDDELLHLSISTVTLERGKLLGEGLVPGSLSLVPSFSPPGALALRFPLVCGTLCPVAPSLIHHASPFPFLPSLICPPSGAVPMEYRSNNFGPPLFCNNQKTFYHLDNRQNKSGRVHDTMWLVRPIDTLTRPLSSPYLAPI